MASLTGTTRALQLSWIGAWLFAGLIGGVVSVAGMGVLSTIGVIVGAALVALVMLSPFVAVYGAVADGAPALERALERRRVQQKRRADPCAGALAIPTDDVGALSPVEDSTSA